MTSPISAQKATKQHIRGSTLLLVGRVIAMTTNFAVQVMIVRYLSKSDYGGFAYALSVVSLGSSIAVFGMDRTVTRFLPIYQEKGEHSKLFGSLILMITTILSLSFFLVLVVFGLQGWLTASYIKNQQTVRLLLLLVFLIPVQAFDSLLVGMLAIFAKPSTIFFRRYVLGPGLKLLVVLSLILFGFNVFFLSFGYLVTGILGVTIYSGILFRDLRNQDLWKRFKGQKLQFPIKEVFGFSIPLITANFVYIMRTQIVIVLLEHFHHTRYVADFRAVQPVSELNAVVIRIFSFLFLPAMARMYAKSDQEGVNDLYWQSASWITLLTFPVFLVTFSLAQPVTLLLFGERYAASGSIMALLAIGYFFHAALGFNADTLRIYGKFRYTVAVDFFSMLFSLGLNLILIPEYGAVGAAIGTCCTLVLYNILNHIGLRFATPINLFNRRHFKMYASIAFGTLALVLIQNFFSTPFLIDLFFAGLISLIVLLVNRNILMIEQTFPELLRFPIVRLLFKSPFSKPDKLL